MPFQKVNLGATGTGAGGDDLRTALTKLNANLDKTAELDSDALKAMIRAIMKLFGIGSSNGVTSVIDPNTVRESGFYQGSGANGINWPGDSKYGYLIHIVRNADRFFQIAAYANGPGIEPQFFFRGSADTGATWSEWRGTWHDGNLKKQTTLLDATVGSIMSVGAFGLGGPSQVSNDWDSIAVTGFYCNTIGTATGTPISGVSPIHLIHVESSNGAVQLAMRANVTLPQTWRRSRAGITTWGAWQEVAYTDSPSFTGNPTAPTQASDNNSTRLATTAFVRAAMAQFGVGGAVNLTNRDLNTLTTAGSYYVSSPTNGPAGVGSGYITVLQYDTGASFGAQLYMPSTNVAGNDLWYRRRINTTWGGWIKLASVDEISAALIGLTPDKAFRRGNILGTVSADASGIPTGAVIEKGSNTNGEYVKFADGTLICTGIVGAVISVTDPAASGFQKLAGTATFPAAFSVVPKIAYSSQAQSGWLSIACSDSSPTTTRTGQAYLWSPNNAARGQVTYIAVGRWF